jgi:hypothetical protein
MIFCIGPLHSTGGIIFIGSCLAERKLSEHFKDSLVDVFASMIKPKFAFFQMKIESMFLQASETNKPGFGEPSEAFYTVNM